MRTIRARKAKIRSQRQIKMDGRIVGYIDAHGATSIYILMRELRLKKKTVKACLNRLLAIHELIIKADDTVPKAERMALYARPDLLQEAGLMPSEVRKLNEGRPAYDLNPPSKDLTRDPDPLETAIALLFQKGARRSVHGKLERWILPGGSSIVIEVFAGNQIRIYDSVSIDANVDSAMKFLRRTL